jgi:hypothetical protein
MAVLSAGWNSPHLAGISVGYTIDRYGNEYFSPAINFGLPGISASLGGFVLPLTQNYSSQDIQNFMTRWFFNPVVSTGAPSLGVQYSPGYPSYSLELGVATPQAGIAAGYTLQVPPGLCVYIPGFGLVCR